MKYLVVLLLLALMALGVAYDIQRRHGAGIEDAREKAVRAAVEAKRAALEADTKGRQEIARWKATAARHEAEVRRLRGAAVAAAKEVKAIEKAGERLEREGTPDEILAKLRAQGIRAEWCRP